MIRYWSLIPHISDICELQKLTFGWTVDNVQWTSPTVAVGLTATGQQSGIVADFCKTSMFQIIRWSIISFCFIWALSWTVDIQSQLLLQQFVCRTGLVRFPDPLLNQVSFGTQTRPGTTESAADFAKHFPSSSWQSDKYNTVWISNFETILCFVKSGHNPLNLYFRCFDLSGFAMYYNVHMYLWAALKCCCQMCPLHRSDVKRAHHNTSGVCAAAAEVPQVFAAKSAVIE